MNVVAWLKLQLRTSGLLLLGRTGGLRVTSKNAVCISCSLALTLRCTYTYQPPYNSVQLQPLLFSSRVYAGMAVSELEVEGIVFPQKTRPPGSGGTLFLAGAGARGLEIGGNFVKFTAIGVYLEEAAVPALAGKWGGKAGDELAADAGFFGDVVTGEFDKFTRVTMILPLTGEQYSEKVTENCVAYWKATGVYTDAEGEAVEKFKETFRSETFPPGSSILFTHSSNGTLTIAFSKDASAPEVGSAVIENKAFCEAILESIIGEHGVSPEAKRSLATRVSELLKESPVTGVAKMPMSVSV